MMRKKYLLTCGFATLVTPILPIALVVSCSDDAITPAQQAVDAEQAKVDKLSTHTITASAEGVDADNGIAFTQALAAKFGIDGFSPNADKFNYNLSNLSLVEDGDLALTIAVSDKIDPNIKGKPHALSVAVTGITAAQAQADKDYLETITASDLNGNRFANLAIAADTQLSAASAQLKMASPNGDAIALPYPKITVSVSKATNSTDVHYVVYTTSARATLSVSFTKFAPIGLDEFLDFHPDAIANNKVVNDAFKNQSLPAGFMLPENVTAIGNRAFMSAVLPLGFAIPKSVTSLGIGAFWRVVLPFGFTIPESVTSIDKGAFVGATFFAGFVIPKTVVSISPYAFIGAILPAGYVWEKDGTEKTLSAPIAGGHRYEVVLE